MKFYCLLTFVDGHSPSSSPILAIWREENVRRVKFLSQINLRLWCRFLVKHAWLKYGWWREKKITEVISPSWRKRKCFVLVCLFDLCLFDVVSHSFSLFSHPLYLLLSLSLSIFLTLSNFYLKEWKDNINMQCHTWKSLPSLNQKKKKLRFFFYFKIIKDLK